MFDMFDPTFTKLLFTSVYSSIILIAILSFVTPIMIYLVCSKIINKPLLNIPICLALLAYSVYDHIFAYRIHWGMEIDIVKNLLDFFKGESLMVVFYLWMPGVISFTLINIALFIERQMKKEANK